MSNAIQFTVDSKLRTPLDGLSRAIEKELCEEFTHNNPKYHKLARMSQAWAKGEQPEISTWSINNNELQLPRGGAKRVRAVLERFGMVPKWDDQRTEGAPEASNWCPPHYPTGVPVEGESVRVTGHIWDHQERIRDACVRKQNCLARAPTGCISGDTMIGINRAGKGSQCRLDHLVKMFNGGKASGRVWRESIPTMVRARTKDGTVRLIKLNDAYESGIKPVFRVEFSSGHFVKATKDHRFLTADGWKRLENISVGDLVEVESSNRPTAKTKKPKPWYRMRKAKFHPHVGRKGVKPGKGGHTVPLHRLVVEAQRAAMTVEQFITACNDPRCMSLINPSAFIDPKVYAVHHKDLNALNNDPSNLQVMTHEEHRIEHRDLSITNISVRTEMAAVNAIMPCGEEMTFDLSLDDPHNFLANGVVVHNSGKTTAAIAMLPFIQLATVVVVYDGGLRKQWVDRIAKELGVDRSDIGIIGDGKFQLKPITIAMQQTLSKLPPHRWQRVNEYFGCVICDEVQRFAAKTFMKVVDKFSAKYRIGISADESRKDEKEFLIYDLFGDCAVDISLQELIDKGLIHDVSIRIVPTTFRADWYVKARKSTTKTSWKEKSTPDFNKLLVEVCGDEKRNKLAMNVAFHELDQTHQVIMFTHRREHCVDLNRLAAERGQSTGMMRGSKPDAEEFDRTIAALKARELSFASGTIMAVGQGLDIPSVARGVAMTNVMNNRQQFGQLRGRICRLSPGKTDAILYVMWDEHIYGIAGVKNLIRWNNDVKVLHESEWLDAKEFVKLKRAQETSGKEFESKAKSNIDKLFRSAKR